MSSTTFYEISFFFFPFLLFPSFFFFYSSFSFSFHVFTCTDYHRVNFFMTQDAEFYSRPQSSTPNSASPRPLSVSSTSAYIPHRQPSMTREESDLGSEAISHISQDINTFGVNNPFGYLGKCSCVWWIQRARVELGKSHPQLVNLDTMVDPRVPSVEKLGMLFSPVSFFLLLFPQGY